MPQEIIDKQQYEEQIKLFIPVNELDPQQQMEVFQLARIFRYKKREYIFRQGDRDEFSFYNLQGEIQLLADRDEKSTITGGTETARYAMARLQPRQFSARAKTEAIVLQLDRAALDRLMVLENDDDLPRTTEVHVTDIGEEDSGDWMTKMLQSELFCHLPTANIHQLFELIQPMEFKASDTVMSQGEIGDYYYIIQEGRCEVSRAPRVGAKPVKLAELSPGDSFGEEALLVEAKRNATITMLSDGVLMQLSRDNFMSIIRKSTLYTVSFKEGRKLVEEGALWLDVRFPNEHEESRIEDSINIPLNDLRTGSDNLKKDKKYVIYCDSGGRSSAAAFMLIDKGYDVVYLADGLSVVPPEERESASRADREKKQGTAARAGLKLVKPAKTPLTEKPATENRDEELNEMKPEIRASVIDANLGWNKLELEKAKYQAEQEQAREEVKAEQARLEAEKKKLEEEKKKVEQEARSLREQEEKRINKMRQEAEKRMAEEKKKLEQVYSRNTKEMEKLERYKKEVEEQLNKERQKLEKDTLKAREKLQEADELKQHIEGLRASFEKESAKRKSEQEALEEEIKTKAREKLEKERRKLAEVLARTNEEMSNAQRERAAADAARKAAEEEAQKIIAEYREQFEKERTAEQQRLAEERRKLMQEADKIQESLTDIQKTKQEAEEARRLAEQEALKLREMQREIEAEKDKEKQNAIVEEIRQAEEKLDQATRNLEDVKQAEETAQAAQDINRQEMEEQEEEQDRMKKQVEEDLAQFMREQEQQAESREKMDAHAEHVKRIRQRAEAAKRAAEKATDELFADIASQLGSND